MTREDIEKAAEQNISCHTEFDFAEILANLGRECFCYGAEWRINNVWHTDLSKVKPCLPILVIFKKSGRVGMFEDIRGLKGLENMVEAFAYIEDLIPSSGYITKVEKI